MWATGGNPNVLNMAYKSNIELGDAVNRNAMKDFRIYMAVGGMPQAVERYIAKICSMPTCGKEKVQ